MIFTLEVRRARKGDCLLVHFGKPHGRGLVVIDGGPSQVYQPHLKPRLTAIRTALGLAPQEPLAIDLLMVSHIDDDHMAGVLELTGELVEAQRDRRPAAFRVRRLWHNTFDDIIGNDPTSLIAAVTTRFGAASLAGEPDVAGLDPDAAKVLASVSQGIQLRDDARALRLKVNPEFPGALVMAAKQAKAVSLGKGLRLTVAGPMKAELAALQKEHDYFLAARQAKAAGKAKTPLAAFTDDSAPNLSSIVVLAEVSGKRMLLTGDARGDKILEGLELAGIVKRGKGLHVDVLKMPHHGSDRNMDRAFLERVTADHYVFSGDGEHGNPERATLEMLLAARGDVVSYTVHLTYPVDEIDRGRKADWEKEQQKERSRKRTRPLTVVRGDWSAYQHGLAALLDGHPKLARNVQIVPDAQPHLIELLDPVGF